MTKFFVFLLNRACVLDFVNPWQDTAQRLTLVHEMLTVPALVTLARVPSRDCRLDATRALAHLGCNEENHETMYRQVRFEGNLKMACPRARNLARTCLCPMANRP